MNVQVKQVHGNRWRLYSSDANAKKRAIIILANLEDLSRLLRSPAHVGDPARPFSRISFSETTFKEAMV
jgi:hypothetical protein